MIIRLARATQSVLLFPLCHLVVVLLLSIREQIPLEEGFWQFGSQVLALAFAPLAVLKGRYPSLLEIYLKPQNLLFLIVSIFLIWIAGSKMLIQLARRLRARAAPFSARYRWAGGGLLLIVLLGWLALPYRPTSTTARITIDIAHTMGAMPVHARNFSQGGEALMRQPGQFDTTMQLLAPLDPHLVRIDHLYDYYDVYHEGEDGEPVYDWTALDRAVDAILSAGAAPLMTISYCPPPLAGESIYGPPTNWERWEELVYQTVYHFNVERGLDIRYWEVWNEPNLPHFWNGTIEDYLTLYRVTAQGALRADPTLQLGGPATSSEEIGGSALLLFFERDWIVTLADYTQQHKLPLDFVSWHLYDERPHYFARSIERHRRWVEDVRSQPELLLTEWNWNDNGDIRLDNGQTVAFAAAVLHTLADADVDQAFYFEPMDGSRDWNGDWGLIREDGTVKPIFYAFQLLGQLQGDRLQVTSDHESVSALATRNGDTVSVLVWHYHSGHQTITVNLTLTGLAGGSSYPLAIYGVGHVYGNPYYGQSDTLVGRQILSEDGPGTWPLALKVPADGIRLVQFDVSEGAN